MSLELTQLPYVSHHPEQPLREAWCYNSSHFTDEEIKSWGKMGYLPQLPTAS